MVSNILRGIHLVRISTQVQMIAFLHTLDEWVDENPKVRMTHLERCLQAGQIGHYRYVELSLQTAKYGHERQKAYNGHVSYPVWPYLTLG